MHIFGRTLSKLFVKTIDAMTSDRTVRRLRIRVDSERDLRRQNDRANYMLVTTAHSKRYPACGTRTRRTNRASPTGDGVTDNMIFELSTRDALDRKQIAEKHFYLICCDV